jgi:hypothetical protein
MPASLPEEPLPRAVALFVWTTSSSASTPTTLAALALAWEAAVAHDRDAWATRARARGVAADSVARAIEDNVVASLVRLLEPLDVSGVALADQPALLTRALEELRAQRLDALEIAIAALAQRLEGAGDAAVPLPVVSELREWAAIRALYDEVARVGTDGRGHAWQAAHATACGAAVHLWNVRREHRLGNAMNRWLRDEAALVGDARALATYDANVACGP